MPSKRKVVLIGTGAVGSTYAYTLMRSGLAGEIALIDIDRERLEGEALDMNHGLFFSPPVNIHAGDYSDCRDADLVVIGTPIDLRRLIDEAGFTPVERDSLYRPVERDGTQWRIEDRSES